MRTEKVTTVRWEVIMTKQKQLAAKVLSTYELMQKFPERAVRHRLSRRDSAAERREVRILQEQEREGTERQAEFLSLHRRYALPRRNEQVHRIQPLVQRDVRAMKYRPDPDTEILFVVVAMIEIRFAFPFPHVLALAVSALHAVPPQNPGEVVDGGLLIGKLLHQLVGR